MKRKSNTNEFGVIHFLKSKSIVSNSCTCCVDFYGKQGSQSEACNYIQKHFKEFRKFVHINRIKYADCDLLKADKERINRKKTFNRVRFYLKKKGKKDSLCVARCLMNKVYGYNWREVIINN